jgi:general stress protein 26
MTNASDPAVSDVLRRAMLARIASLSRNGRPSVTPIYFVWQNGHVWLGTAEWTLAVRDVKADQRVSILFNI